jgi:hypothetical protein
MSDEDVFDTFETAEVDEDIVVTPVEEEPTTLRSARDFLKHKVSKKMEDGSPAWKDGYSAGYLDGLREGKLQGYRQGWERAISDSRLPT